jgi:mRNA-degrading endonuclease toxin of MazEF toxin-antitoxin module
MKRRDVILARVFFTDSNESKIRPAIVLSDEKYHAGDYLLVAAITTAIDDYCLPISEKDINCQLDKNSTARFDGIIKLHKNQVIKIIGKVSPDFHLNLVSKIIRMLG